MNQDISGATSPNLYSDESSVSGGELRKVDAYWRASNCLSLGMFYLSSNPLLREPLQVKHIKERLIGHWGSDPGQSFIRVHLNRLIKKYDLNMIYVAGPGHGAPATLANSYLEGRYSEVYRDMSEKRGGDGAILQTVLISRRNRRPLHSKGLCCKNHFIGESNQSAVSWVSIPVGRGRRLYYHKIIGEPYVRQVCWRITEMAQRSIRRFLNLISVEALLRPYS